ncbi:type II toxin-antitoxin system ParD family antitoxin [Sandarakinorhabdus sp.]|uniref:type II toxin-antitoxin system ParD family antitoxin n=1 Tax=Sandarakinorhabdus sp. TaxID=1916663 RepID=UPI003F7118B1
MAAMNVSLSPELDRFVRESVTEGRYQSSSEVVREALRLLQDRQRLDRLKLEALRAEIQRGLDSGPASLFDVAAIKAQARAQYEREFQSKTEG